MSSLNSDLTVPFYNITFWRKDISSAGLYFLYSGFNLFGIPQISAASGPRRLFEGGASVLTFLSQMRRLFE